jgi:hypothetical protein
MKKQLIIDIVTLVIIVLAIWLANAVCYHAGYKKCESKYKRYYNATETLLDSIDDNYMLDIVMEGDVYNNYIVAKENLK